MQQQRLPTKEKDLRWRYKKWLKHVDAVYDFADKNYRTYKSATQQKIHSSYAVRLIKFNC